MEPMGNLVATSLDDLADVEVIVTLQRPDGRPVDVRLRALTQSEMTAIRRQIKWPEPPVKDFRKVGDEVIPLRNYEDPDYIKAVEDANNRLAGLIFVASLKLEVPGNTPEEKLEQVESRLGQWAAAQLLEATQKINIMSQEVIAGVARSFRSAGTYDTPGNDAAGVDTQLLEEFAEGPDSRAISV